MTSQEPHTQHIADPDVPDTEVILLEQPAPVFVDSTGRRRRLLRRFAYGFGAFCMVYGGLISLSLAGGPVSPNAALPFPELIDGGAPPVGLPRPTPEPIVTAPKSVLVNEATSRRGGAWGGSTVTATRATARPTRAAAPTTQPTASKPTTRPVEATPSPVSTPTTGPSGSTAPTTTPSPTDTVDTGTGGTGGGTAGDETAGDEIAGDGDPEPGDADPDDSESDPDFYSTGDDCPDMSTMDDSIAGSIDDGSAILLVGASGSPVTDPGFPASGAAFEAAAQFIAYVEAQTDAAKFRPEPDVWEAPEAADDSDADDDWGDSGESGESGDSDDLDDSGESVAGEPADDTEDAP